MLSSSVLLCASLATIAYGQMQATLDATVFEPRQDQTCLDPNKPIVPLSNATGLGFVPAAIEHALIETSKPSLPGRPLTGY